MVHAQATHKMPAGIIPLFFIQIFATITFSVLYSTLILFITRRLHFTDTHAASIIAAFAAFNFGLHLLGGYVGGRWLSFRTLFVVGMCLQVTACVFLTFETTPLLYWGLAAFLTGAGLNVTCINCMVTQLFTPDDTRREKAFLWNYSGMNIGFFVGFSLAGYFHLNDNYVILFCLGGLSNIITIMIAGCNWKALADRDTILSALPKQALLSATLKGAAFVFVLFFAMRWIMAHSSISHHLVLFTGIVMGIIMGTLAWRQPTVPARKKMLAYITLTVSAIFFWSLYQLGPMSLMLFIDRNVDRHLGSWLIAPQWFNNVNTLIIVIGAPLLATAFQKLRQRGVNINIPVQFSAALLFIGLGFLALPLGIHWANPNGLSNSGWVFLCYAFQSLGELFISPIGYAMIGQLAPARLQGIMMGTWMLGTGIGASLSGLFSKWMLAASASQEPLISNAAYSHSFGMLGGSAVIIGFVLLVLIPFLSRLIGR